ncbi:MAG: hypothetical protein J2P37_13970 [Ktedonobacteraceae bacterium]|nr:hypothetical protein [Ktedonobacteraceae bacterium]MBO0795932.1 hypothetical protein [Ktedonobacteraceae bacterium]
MQWIIVFALLLSLLCIILGWRKSTQGKSKSRPALQHCAACGWTTEQVQYCEFEHKRIQVIEPLCFECAIERDAIPVGTLSAIAS